MKKIAFTILAIFSSCVVILSCKAKPEKVKDLRSGYTLIVNRYKPDSLVYADTVGMCKDFIDNSADYGYNISMIELLGNPIKYHKKRVTINGYFLFEFEGEQLYFSELDYKNSNSKNSVWILIPDSSAAKKEAIDSLNGRYVWINGEFDMFATGHMGCCSGTLNKIGRILYRSRF